MDVYYKIHSEKTVFTDLADVIFYMDFSGVFEAGQSRRSQERRKKAESLFRPEGVSLDFGSGPRSYVAFERSGSVSRQAKLSFIRADLYDAVCRRIMLDMEIETCQLSKLYAYNGLITVQDTFSSRVGQICNAAFDRSVIAYDENSDVEERERRRQETETLAILVGLEIDSAKSGVKPNLDAFLKERTVKRSQFLRYKELLGDSRGTAEKRRKIIEETDWSQVSSNVEKLPYYAAMLRDHTPRLKPVPATDAELFEFAADPNWKDVLDPGILADVDSLLRDCLACLSRIRACRAPIGSRKRERDIRLVLFARGQEVRYDVDELYAAFPRLEQEQAEELCQAVREQKWQLMDREARLDFLSESLPGYEEWYTLLADFRAGGYRVLGDLLCDVCEENRSTERKRLHRETDSAAFTAMMDAYENCLYARSYREAVASACRKELEKIIDPQRAVRYIVALGRRDLLWDLVPDQIEREAAKGKRP